MLKGKVTIITGAGRGLGEAIAKTLARDGAITVVADKDTQAANRVASALRSQDYESMPLTMDVGDPEVVREAFLEVLRTYGHVDVLINNAAIDKTVPIDELEVEEWQNIIQTNLSGPFIVSKQAFRAMSETGGGQIVNIVSTAALRAWPNASAYHASKWGLRGLSHALHVEGRAKGIKVTAVISGGMRTPFLLERFPDIDPAVLQDPLTVARTVSFVLSLPDESVIPEIMVIPMKETSWP